MTLKNQLTGMQGVYLVAAELSRLGYIVSPTSRSAKAADLLVTNQPCTQAFSVQVKTKTSRATYWLLGSEAKNVYSPTHIYVFVVLRTLEPKVSFYIVPSEFVAKHTHEERFRNGLWYSFTSDDATPFENQWLECFGHPIGVGIKTPRS